MIAKHVAMKSARRSSFAGLAAYITTAQSKTERLGEVRTTNISSDDVGEAIFRVQATQQQNTTAKGDRTYHLILSFRPGEKPSVAALREIEAQVCEGLGFAEHERISAVHTDTDNLHVHIAINKIHPTKLTMHEPFAAYRRLGEICQRLETEFGLEVDNHLGRKSPGENRADDMAQASGLDPLRDWIRRECLAELKGAQTWGDLHRIAGENGLDIEARGAGLVIVSRSGVAIKPSTVDRELSKAALETRLGKFIAQAGAKAAPKRQYAKRPAATRVDTDALYARYRADNDTAQRQRQAALVAARAHRDRQIADARRSASLGRATIKLVGGDARRLRYSMTASRSRTAIEQAKREFEVARAEIGRRARPAVWADWLKQQAELGNAEALTALRARRKEPSPGQGVGITAPTVAAAPSGAARVDGVTKSGTIIFASPQAAIRDDGARLSVSRGADIDGIKEALRLARARYGDALTVEGTADFKRRVASIAAATDPAIRFLDPAVERQRAHFQRQWQELTREQANAEPRGAGRDGGADAGDRGRATGARTPARAASGDSGRAYRGDSRARRVVAPVAGVGGLASTAVAAGQSYVGAVGQRPPPRRADSVRRLPELGLVQQRRGGEMLLPSDVHGNVEQPGAGALDGLRRAIRGAGVAPDPGGEAVDSYVAERNGKRSLMPDIQQHLRYNGEAGQMAFMGTRTVNGQTLALFAKGDTIIVKPVDADEIAALPRGRGASVAIENGKVMQQQRKGRGR